MKLELNSPGSNESIYVAAAHQGQIRVFRRRMAGLRRRLAEIAAGPWSKSDRGLGMPHRLVDTADLDQQIAKVRVTSGMKSGSRRSAHLEMRGSVIGLRKRRLSACWRDCCAASARAGSMRTTAASKILQRPRAHGPAP